MLSVEERLDKAYHEFDKPSSIRGVEALYATTKANRKDITNYLSKQDSWSLFKQVNTRNRQRRKVHVYRKNQTWGADLLDVSNMSRRNNGVTFLLVVKDFFTRYCWVKPLKGKSAPVVLQAIQTILNEAESQPDSIISDRGGEFKNATVQKFLKSKKIAFHYPNTRIKVGTVESLNRNIRMRITRYMEQEGMDNYLNVLPDIVAAINLAPNKSTGFSPHHLWTTDNNQDYLAAFQKVFGKEPTNNTSEAKFKIGDVVRKIRERGTFEKRTREPVWSQKLYRVSGIDSYYFPTTYRLESFEDGYPEIGPGFYGWELQLQEEPKVWEVEKLVRKQKKNGVDGYVVKWRFYDKLGWEKTENVQHLL